jgi:ferredoxin
MRAEWENQKWISRWITIGVATLGILIVFFVANSDGMGLFDLGSAVAVGFIFWFLIVSAIEAMLDQLAKTDAPRFVSQNLVMGSILILVLVLLSLSTLTEISGLLTPALTGGAFFAIFYAWRKDKEVHVPLCFIEVENDGKVFSVKRGDYLLDGMESAGYRVLTHCGAQGDCATCRVNVRESEQQFDDSNYGPVLTVRQQNEGWVIGCRVPVEQDMVIRLFKPLVIRWPSYDRDNFTGQARELRKALPGFDCEACGYGTCDEYAVAMSNNSEDPAKCHPGGTAVREKLNVLLNGVKSSGRNNA